MDIEKIRKLFLEHGFNVSVKNFCDINFRNDDFSGTYILYTSQEDPGLKYKGFVEDILLGLREKGATLIPDFKYFRAHHNKVFMEILRDASKLENIKNIKSYYFGTKDEFEYKKKEISLPAVIKNAEGATSSGVYLANAKNIDFIIKKVSFAGAFLPYLKNIVKKILKKPIYPVSLFRNKFIIQNYIEGLKGDFKILVYGEKYYVLERKNRKNDFRASGSGKFSLPEVANTELLNFAKNVFESFDVPFVSLDIAEKNGEFFLIEFQFVMFGTFTIEASSFHFKKVKEVWEKIDEKPDLEAVFCESVIKFIENYEQ
ncbi:MAG: hypothetical protein ACOX2F_03065 [bacterium]